MIKTLVTLIAILACSVQAFSQKGSTIWGDIFTGQVVKTDEASREITLEYSGKDGTETFVGSLKEGYQVKMKDGIAHELKVSELTPGTRIRAYYKKISKEVSGQKVKTNLITRIEFLGRDEFAVMRQYLKVEPSTPVTLVESKTLPDADPLRLKIVGDNPVSSSEIIKWAEGWNKREAKKYGAVSIVSESEQADVTLVIHKGSEALAATIGPMISIFLVVEKLTGLEVIWKHPIMMMLEVTSMPTSVSNEGQVKGLGAQITYEIEKRLKFRYKGKQK
jgi:hypothetical protein